MPGNLTACTLEALELPPPPPGFRTSVRLTEGTIAPPRAGSRANLNAYGAHFRGLLPGWLFSPAC